jgi:hypothetical protein
MNIKQKIFSTVMLNVLFLNMIAANIFIIKAQNEVSTTSEESVDLFNEDKEVEITDVQSLKADFKQYTQDPDSKIVKFEMILTSQINSDRLRITWTVSGISKPVDDNQLTTVLDIKAGQTYTIPIEVTPTGYGVSEVYGKAQAFGADSNVIATVRKNYASNEMGEILPITDDYKNKKLFNLVFSIIKLILILVFVFIGIFFGFKKFTKWYNANDVK